jgi:hypothetical protein
VNVFCKCFNVEWRKRYTVGFNVRDHGVEEKFQRSLVYRCFQGGGTLIFLSWASSRKSDVFVPVAGY